MASKVTSSSSPPRSPPPSTGRSVPRATGSSSASGGAVLRRKAAAAGREQDGEGEGEGGDEKRIREMSSWSERNQWVVYALASGACAAFNGVFAKLTTNDLTTRISGGVSTVLGLEGVDRVLEIVVRCIFFGLNLAFNGVMWTLFTQALAKGTSTTKVSIMNTSTNFILTALLGLFVFSESLPPLWWVGASLLVAGNVIIGRKDEGQGQPACEREPSENVDGDGVGERGVEEQIRRKSAGETGGERESRSWY
ncbi:hypothetical protein F5Y17DRAFT_262272 [Xylariaceae sp. FL0594]|nr:hypothetical protein F5Y17DRAFT_262272 [Xylariaceae sp. FL0594]